MRKRKYVSLHDIAEDAETFMGCDRSLMASSPHEQPADAASSKRASSRSRVGASWTQRKRTNLPIIIDDGDEDDEDIQTKGASAAKRRKGCGGGNDALPEEEEEEEGYAGVGAAAPAPPEDFPVPQCHNIVSTSQIVTSQTGINLQRLADLFPFTTYDRKRFAAITIRLANPRCTCLLFGSGKLVITGSVSFSACIVASHEITSILRKASPRDTFEVSSCQIQNLVAHVSLPPGTTIDLNGLYERFNEQSTYQRSIFPGLVLRPPRSPIVLLIFTSGRIVCTGGRSYDDIYYGFGAIYGTLLPYVHFAKK